ncbi:TauD/TfdA family dioxygenase [Pseudomonas akapageensis]|uniref:TauD/TfdA family dioxygenase n=1 Tax=Pseudomonas akapageensis TaxID=2609961 RepID=UPI0014083F78|nr:TauD/TfdA family dioxygenase [Pseudomonas akapageensis]
MTTVVKKLVPSAQEKQQIRSLLDEIMKEPGMGNQYLFMEKAALYAQELPRRIREEFYQFKRREESAVLLVSENPVLLNGAGPSPSKHIEIDPEYRLNDAKILHGLYGSLLGEGIGFTSQREGSIYNNIVPLKDYSKIPNSSGGSNLDFGFHVEDAFHPARAEYLGLVCMRNDECAATTVSCIDGIELTPEEKRALFELRFKISHNPIHSTSNVVEETSQAILFGHEDMPYVKINAARMNLDEYQGVERRALEKLLHHFEQNRVAMMLKPTDCIFVDNYRCVHARDSFEANYGEGARWLARVVFASNLRKSRTMRDSVATRAINA